ncbi:MAG: efflux RND transporter periplasmic adaptor subunit [Alphaproteobacteria bacterium]
MAAVLCLAAGSVLAAEHTVVRRSVNDLKAGFATVEATQALDARARIGGTVGRLTVREGDWVNEGQTIAVVGDRKLSFEVSAVDARASSLGAEVNQAQIDFRRVKDLVDKGVMARAKLDEAQTRLNVAERQLAAMRAERDVASTRSKEGSVDAPTAGRVLKVNIVNGSVVMPGDVIAVIARESYVLRMNMPERNARFIKVGAPVFVGPRDLEDVRPESMRQGKVVLVYPRMDRGRVVADMDVDGLGDYFVGERALVYVTAGTRDAYVVPPEYLYRRFGVTYVRLKTGAEVVVQPGQPVEGGIEILSGLKDNDVVVTP